MLFVATKSSKGNDNIDVSFLPMKLVMALNAHANNKDPEQVMSAEESKEGADAFTKLIDSLYVYERSGICSGFRGGNYGGGSGYNRMFSSHIGQARISVSGNRAKTFWEDLTKHSTKVISDNSCIATEDQILSAVGNIPTYNQWERDSRSCCIL